MRGPEAKSLLILLIAAILVCYGLVLSMMWYAVEYKDFFVAGLILISYMLGSVPTEIKQYIRDEKLLSRSGCQREEDATNG